MEHDDSKTGAAHLTADGRGSGLTEDGTRRDGPASLAILVLTVVLIIVVLFAILR